MEIWKVIPGFEGYYEASDMGRIRGIDRIIETTGKKAHTRLIKSRVLKFSLSHGYHSYVLWVNHKQTTIRSHVAVAYAFLGDRPSGMYVCHANGDRSDNRLANVYYGTPKQNSDDAARHGTRPIGESCSASKLKATDVVNIRAKAKSISQRKICEEFGISRAQASRVINGVHWSHLGAP